MAAARLGGGLACAVMPVPQPEQAPQQKPSDGLLPKHHRNQARSWAGLFGRKASDRESKPAAAL